MTVPNNDDLRWTIHDCKGPLALMPNQPKMGNHTKNEYRICDYLKTQNSSMLVSNKLNGCKSDTISQIEQIEKSYFFLGKSDKYIIK